MRIVKIGVSLLPRPELEEQRKAPLKQVMPGVEAAEEEMKKPEN